MKHIKKYLKEKKYDIIYFHNDLTDFTVNCFLVLFKNERFFSLNIDLVTFDIEDVNLDHWLENLDNEDLNTISMSNKKFKSNIRDFRLKKILKK